MLRPYHRKTTRSSTIHENFALRLEPYKMLRMAAPTKKAGAVTGIATLRPKNGHYGCGRMVDGRR